MLGSKEAARAAAAAGTLEEVLNGRTFFDDEQGKWMPRSEHWTLEDEERLEIAQVRYKQAMRRLKIEFPALELLPCAVDGEPAGEHNSRPCHCGHGRQGLAPWVLGVWAHGFCECDAAMDESIRWRLEFVAAGDPKLAW